MGTLLQAKYIRKQNIDRNRLLGPINTCFGKQRKTETIIPL